MKTVQFHTLDDAGRDKMIGSIAWDGRQLVLDPPDSELLREVLAEPVRDHRTKTVLRATENPDGWLDALRFSFRSSHLRATAPEGR